MIRSFWRRRRIFRSAQSVFCACSTLSVQHVPSSHSAAASRFLRRCFCVVAVEPGFSLSGASQPRAQFLGVSGVVERGARTADVSSQYRRFTERLECSVFEYSMDQRSVLSVCVYRERHRSVSRWSGTGRHGWFLGAAALGGFWCIRRLRFSGAGLAGSVLLACSGICVLLGAVRRRVRLESGFVSQRSVLLCAGDLLDVQPGIFVPLPREFSLQSLLGCFQEGPASPGVSGPCGAGTLGARVLCVSALRMAVPFRPVPVAASSTTCRWRWSGDGCWCRSPR